MVCFPAGLFCWGLEGLGGIVCLFVFSLLFGLLGFLCCLGSFCYSSSLRSFLCFEGVYISLGFFVCSFQVCCFVGFFFYIEFQVWLQLGKVKKELKIH